MDNEAAQVPAQPIKVSVEDAGPQQGEGAGPGGGAALHARPPGALRPAGPKRENKPINKNK